MTLSKTLIRNKEKFLNYNQFRKDLFQHFSPNESDVILFLLPWLICINHPDFPGYISGLKKPFRIFGIDHDWTIKKREPSFKKRFKCSDRGPILKFAADYNEIEGIYTIGSIGTISQTSYSDCDLWLCINRANYTARQAAKLHEKIARIKDWLDSTLKMTVHFFISDINDIQKGYFGSVDRESCGSTQRNVLKEEFYRTTIVISGKIPFWWVYYDAKEPRTYNESLAEYYHANFPHNDCVDLGNLETIEQDEYFGAALWQFNKALTRPLKSIIKMIILAVQLKSPRGKLFCHLFRDLIMSKKRDETLIDPSMFVLDTILDYFEKEQYSNIDFLKQCLYLRYEIKMLSGKITLKEEISSPLFSKHKLDRKCIHDLNQFESWSFQKQQEFCTKVLNLLREIYKDIVAIATNVSGRVTPHDMTIIGMKLSSCLAHKENKVPIILKPFANFNVPNSLFRFDGKKWYVTPSQNQDTIVVCNNDIVFCAAYLVWNDLFSVENIRMMPNPTPITIQEIIDLSRKIKEVFGSYNISTVELSHFLSPEKIIKILIIVELDTNNQLSYGGTYRVISQNNWDELFVHQFTSTNKFISYLKNQVKFVPDVENYHYLQHGNLTYKENLTRSKREAMAKIFSQAIMSDYNR